LQFLIAVNNNNYYNNNKQICVRNFKGAGARQYATEKRKERKLGEEGYL